MKKIIFSIIALLLFVFGNVFAWQQKHMMDTQRGAIIMESAVSVKSTPAANGTDLFILHEGAEVRVIDNVGDWVNIELPDGRQGWTMAAILEKI